VQKETQAIKAEGEGTDTINLIFSSESKSLEIPTKNFHNVFVEWYLKGVRFAFSPFLFPAILFISDPFSSIPLLYLFPSSPFFYAPSPRNPPSSPAHLSSSLPSHPTYHSRRSRVTFSSKLPIPQLQPFSAGHPPFSPAHFSPFPPCPATSLTTPGDPKSPFLPS
jgi:hypothetical protein